MPKRGERHGPSHAIVDAIVVGAERHYPGLSTTRSGTLRLIGNGTGVVLGRAYPQRDHDRAGGSWSALLSMGPDTPRQWNGRCSA